MVADGLSARAVHEGAVPLLAALKPALTGSGWHLAPVVVATQARWRSATRSGPAQGPRRRGADRRAAGLSSPDSLGIYLTFDPRPGRTDAERNCLSNVRAAGLKPDLAAFKLHWLIAQALSRRLTGVALKDESDRVLAGPDGRGTLGKAKQISQKVVAVLRTKICEKTKTKRTSVGLANASSA